MGKEQILSSIGEDPD